VLKRRVRRKWVVMKVLWGGKGGELSERIWREKKGKWSVEYKGGDGGIE
jgi:hypothetical protein